MKYDWLVFFSSFLFKLSSFCSAGNFVLKLVFTCIFAISFHCSAFSNVSRFNTRMETLKYLFSFCLPNSIIYSNFSASVGHFVAQQRSDRMSCFLIILTQQVSFYWIKLHFEESVLTIVPNFCCLMKQDNRCGLNMHGLYYANN